MAARRQSMEDSITSNTFTALFELLLDPGFLRQTDATLTSSNATW